jgi:hypothetical protein
MSRKMLVDTCARETEVYTVYQCAKELGLIIAKLSP